MPEAWIPTQLQPFTNGAQRVQVSGDTVGAIIKELAKRYPGLEAYLILDGELMPGLAVIVDGDQTNLGLLQPVSALSEVHFLPAVGGG